MGIKSYNLRQSSLEEVFIEIGEKENREYEMQASSGRRYSLLPEAPKSDDRSCWRTFNTFGKMHFRNSLHICMIMAVLAPAVCLIMGLSSSVVLRAPTPSLALNDYQNIYSSDLPLTVPYNSVPVNADSSDSASVMGNFPTADLTTEAQAFPVTAGNTAIEQIQEFAD